MQQVFTEARWQGPRDDRQVDTTWRGVLISRKGGKGGKGGGERAGQTDRPGDGDRGGDVVGGELRRHREKLKLK